MDECQYYVIRTLPVLLLFTPYRIVSPYVQVLLVIVEWK